MNEFDIIGQHTDKFDKALDIILKRANRRMQAMLSEFKTSGGKLVISDENIQLANNIVDRFYQTLDEAGFGKLADKYRSDFLKISQEINTLVTKPIAFTFLPKDRSLLTAIQTANYEGLFRVSAEVGNTIQRMVIDHIMLEQPMYKVVDELKVRLEDTLKRYAKTHIETTTRQAIQKMEEISVENVGIDLKDAHWEYFGPLDKDTRHICELALADPLFTNAQKENFEEEHGIRYNCRHKFNYIPKELYEKQTNL